MTACPLCNSAKNTLIAKNTRSGTGEREFHQCGVCRLVFVPAEFHLSPAEEKERYDLHENDPADERYIRFLSKLTQPLSAHLEGRQRGLDYGCGPGPALAGILEARGHEVLNYDPYYFADRTLLKGPYDFISASEVIEHFRAPREEFLKIQGLLRPKGGTLGVMTEMYTGNQDKPFDQWWYITEPTHLCFYEPATFGWIASWLNWKIIFQEGNVVLFRS